MKTRLTILLLFVLGIGTSAYTSYHVQVAGPPNTPCCGGDPDSPVPLPDPTLPVPGNSNVK